MIFDVDLHKFRKFSFKSQEVKISSYTWKADKTLCIYPKAIKLRTQQAKTKNTAIIHITNPPILKHLLFSLAPAAMVNDPAMIMKIPDQSPPELMLAHHCVAATIMMIPKKNVMIPLTRIATPKKTEKKLLILYPKSYSQKPFHCCFNWFQRESQRFFS